MLCFCRLHYEIAGNNFDGQERENVFLYWYMYEIAGNNFDGQERENFFFILVHV